jgi:molybdenum cofactor cytidylyltransferase
MMVTGILLAAGQSSRFGSSKCLAQLPDGTPLVIRSIENLRSVVDRILIVVRPDDQPLIDLLQRYSSQRDLEVVMCPAAVEGMAESIKCGVAASDDADAWLIAFADMPFIKSSSSTAVAQQLLTPTDICVPFLQSNINSQTELEGRRGHPVGFGSFYRQALLELEGDVGARSILKQYQQRIKLVGLDDQGILLDIDRPEDLPAQ